MFWKLNAYIHQKLVNLWTYILLLFEECTHVNIYISREKVDYSIVEWSKSINGLGREGKRKGKRLYMLLCIAYTMGLMIWFFLCKQNKESHFQTLKQNVGPKPVKKTFKKKTLFFYI